MQDYPFRTTPFPHQLKEFTDHWRTPGRAILWEPGTGKTKLMIDVAGALYLADEIDGVVVVAPNGVHRNWATDEIPVHLPKAILEQSHYEFWHTGKAGTKYHQRAMAGLLAHKGLAWIMMSYDAAMTVAGKKYLWDFLRKRRVLYVMDEGHAIKSPGAKRTKSIVASTKYAPYRRLLTGTPIATGPFDLYSQVQAIDEQLWDRHEFGSYRVFKFHFGQWFTAADCHQLHGYDPGFDKLLGYKHLDQLADILGTVSSRVTKKDAGLNLPEKLYSKRYYDLTPLQARLYEELRQDYYAEVSEGKIVEAALAIVRLLRFQQIICGYVKVEDEEPVHMLEGPNPRMDALREIIEATPHAGIIWARFTKDVDQIMELLAEMKQVAVRYDGQVSDDEAAEAKRKFQAGEAQWFVGNPAKGKEGLTLHIAQTVVCYNNSFKLLDRLQSEDRAHRIGMKNPVNYIDIVAAGTIDEHIVRALRNKLDIASQITGDELKEWI